MNRPKKSDFHGIRFEITYPSELKDDQEEGALGLTDHLKNSIQILDGQPHEREREVLIHEVLHQMAEYSGIAFRKNQEEQIVSYYGSALLSHIRDNPSFWRYVMLRPPRNHDDDDSSDSSQE